MGRGDCGYGRLTQDDPAGGLLEDLEGVFEVEFLADDGGGVDLDAVEGEFLFLLGEEFCGLGVVGEIPEGEDGEEHGAVKGQKDWFGVSGDERRLTKRPQLQTNIANSQWSHLRFGTRQKQVIRQKQKQLRRRHRRWPVCELVHLGGRRLSGNRC